MYLCFMYSRRLYAKIVGGAVLIVLFIPDWLLVVNNTVVIFLIICVSAVYPVDNSVYNPVGNPLEL